MTSKAFSAQHIENPYLKVTEEEYTIRNLFSGA